MALPLEQKKRTTGNNVFTGSEVVEDEVNETDTALCMVQNVPTVDLETSRNVNLEKKYIEKSMGRECCVEKDEDNNNATDIKTTVETSSPPNSMPLSGEPKCNPANPMTYLSGIVEGTFPLEDLSWVRMLCLYPNFGNGLEPHLRMKVWSTLLGATIENIPLKDKQLHVRRGSRADSDLCWDRSLLWHSYDLADVLLKHYSTTTTTGGGGESNMSLDSLAREITACVHILLPKGGTISNEARTAYLPLAANSCGFLLTLFPLLGGNKEDDVDVVKYEVVTILTHIFRQCMLVPPSIMSMQVQLTSHMQFYFLASYHSPRLVQHLDKFCCGWKLPAVDTVNSVETSEMENSKRTSLLNDLEQSVMPQLVCNQRSSDTADGGGDNNGFLPYPMLGALCLNVLFLECSPSMLAPLWDYFIISGSKHKGYFLLLALLLREEDNLLLLEEVELQSHLCNILSGKGLVSSLKDASKLDILLKEVRDLELRTPESFCHFVNEALMHVAAVEEDPRLECHSRAASPSTLASCNQMPHPTEGPPSAGYSHRFTCNQEFEMGLPSVFVTESKVMTSPCETQQSPQTPKTSTEGVTAKTTDKATPKRSSIISRFASAASQAVTGVNQRKTALLNRMRRNNRHPSLSSVDSKEVFRLLHNFHQICLYCTPHEVIMNIGLQTGSLTANIRVGAPYDIAPSDRMPYDMYFPIDCRCETVRSNEGWFKDMFHFGSEKVEDQIYQQLVLDELQPILNKKHICIMGECGTVADYDCISAFAIFLMSNGFPHVSIVHGGFTAVHDTLAYDEIPGMSLSILTDHDPSVYALCRHPRCRP